MQEYQRPDLSRFNEILSADNDEELQKKLRKNQQKQEAAGNKFLGERMLTKNSKCPCGSGRAIKRCCKFIK